MQIQAIGKIIIIVITFFGLGDEWVLTCSSLFLGYFVDFI